MLSQTNEEESLLDALFCWETIVVANGPAVGAQLMWLDAWKSSSVSAGTASPEGKETELTNVFGELNHPLVCANDVFTHEQFLDGDLRLGTLGELVDSLDLPCIAFQREDGVERMTNRLSLLDKRHGNKRKTDTLTQ